jgi:hypothetical protein
MFSDFISEVVLILNTDHLYHKSLYVTTKRLAVYIQCIYSMGDFKG